MLGSLPPKYRLTAWILGLVACAGVGGWVAASTSLPLLWPTGAALGLALGVLAVSSFVHELGPHESGARAHRR